MDRDDVKLVNCAVCRCDLLGDTQDVAAAVRAIGEDCPPPVARRIDGRPYCSRCSEFLYREAERRAYRELRGLPV